MMGREDGATDSDARLVWDGVREASSYSRGGAGSEPGCGVKGIVSVLAVSGVRRLVWTFTSYPVSAATYSFASYLPSTILDFLLHIPHAIMSIRRTFIPVQPHVPPITPLPPPQHPQRLIEHIQQPPVQGGKEKEIETESSDAASDADIDSVSASGASETGGISGSWVSLKDGPSHGLESGKE